MMDMIDCKGADAPHVDSTLARMRYCCASVSAGRVRVCGLRDEDRLRLENKKKRPNGPLVGSITRLFQLAIRFAVNGMLAHFRQFVRLETAWLVKDFKGHFCFADIVQKGSIG
jgi:hypothetical protein